MPNLNKVMLMGNLTRDPELRVMPSNNMPVTNIGLAVNRQWKDRQTGELRKETTFVDCSCFARTAEVVNEHFRKGDPIFVEGRLKLDEWQDRDGNKRSKLSVIIEQFEFIKTRGESNGGGGYQQQHQPQGQQQQQQQYQSQGQYQGQQQTQYQGQQQPQGQYQQQQTNQGPPQGQYQNQGQHQQPTHQQPAQRQGQFDDDDIPF